MQLQGTDAIRIKGRRPLTRLRVVVTTLGDLSPQERGEVGTSAVPNGGTAR
jgi:hypothetical protein